VTHLDSGTRFRRRDVRINIGFLELVSDVAVSVTAVYTATDLTSQRVASRAVERGPSPAEILRERLRRRLAGAGLPFVEEEPVPEFDERGRRRTIADVIRFARARRRAQEAGASVVQVS